jgi:hypothetical protein
VDPPVLNEGISFQPILEGTQQTTRDVLYGAYSGGTKPGMRCAKQGDWKLIKYDVMDGQVRETQLFNLAENPHELIEQHHDPQVTAISGHTPAPHQRNLAGDPRYAEKLKEMELLLLAEMRRLDDPDRLWDQPPLIDRVRYCADNCGGRGGPSYGAAPSDWLLPAGTVMICGSSVVGGSIIP